MLRKIITVGLLFFVIVAFAEKIHVKRAKKLKGGTFNGQKINKLLGNVLMKHESSLLYCDSAYQYVKKNEVIAFGKVRLVHNDSVVSQGSKLVYNGDSRISMLTGEKVTLTDPSMKLETTNLKLNSKTNTSSFINGGVIRTQGALLHCDEGTYFSNKSEYSFRGNVDLVKDDYHLTSDNLLYNTRSQVAVYKGPTHITSKRQCVFANSGQYDFKTKRSYLKGEAIVEDNVYLIKADSLFYDNELGNGYAEQDVFIHSFEDSLTVYGDYGIRTGNQFMSKVYGNALMEKVMGSDTIFLSSDTLVSINDTVHDKNDIYAYKNVKAFRFDLQAVSDSIHYSLNDSMIVFYSDPILWNEQNQITADTIVVNMKNNEIDNMLVKHKAFIVSEDETGKFNQVKGKKMKAVFNNGNIETVDVKGNGESIYYANDENTKALVGMNKVICSSMLIAFDKNELNDIMFLTKPESKFIPPQKLTVQEEQINGFKWLAELRPDKESLLFDLE